MKYAVAFVINRTEEYMRETHGDDCFTDDIGCAIIYDFISEIPPLRTGEYIVEVDDEDGLEVIGHFSMNTV